MFIINYLYVATNLVGVRKITTEYDFRIYTWGAWVAENHQMLKISYANDSVV